MGSDLERLQRSGLPLLKSELETFLINGKGEVFLTSMLQKTGRILDKPLLSLRAERDFSKLPVEGLQQRLGQLQEINCDLQKRKSEVQILLLHQEAEIRKWLEEQLHSFQHKTVVELDAQLRRFDWKTADLPNALYEWFRNDIEDRTFGEVEYLEKTLQVRLRETLMPYVESFAEIAEHLAQELQNIFEFPLKIEITSPELQPRGSFRLEIKDPLEHVSLSAYSYVTYLRKSSSKKRLYRTYHEAIRTHAEGSMGHLRQELMPRIEKTFLSFYRNFDQSANDAVSTISTGLQKAIELQKKESQERAEIERSLNEKMRMIEQMQEDLLHYPKMI